jgi:hypothetical protein
MEQGHKERSQQNFRNAKTALFCFVRQQGNRLLKLLIRFSVIFNFAK